MTSLVSLFVSQWDASCIKMPLFSANQSQLIRSSQKDEYYQSFLRNNANEAFQTLAGKVPQRYCGNKVPFVVAYTLFRQLDT